MLHTATTQSLVYQTEATMLFASVYFASAVNKSVQTNIPKSTERVISSARNQHSTNSILKSKSQKIWWNILCCSGMYWKHNQPQTSENGSQTQFTAGGMHTCLKYLRKCMTWMQLLNFWCRMKMQILNTVLGSRVQSKGKEDEEEEGWKYEFLSSDWFKSLKQNSSFVQFCVLFC